MAYARFFVTLYEALDKREKLPKPPHPGLAQRHFNTGVTAFYQGQLRRALKHFTDAVQLDPEYPLYHYFRALTHRRLGEKDKSLRDARIGGYYEFQGGPLLRRRMTRGLFRIQGSDRMWLEQLRLGEPHYDPRRDESLPEDARAG